jgi:hypothetical protein
MASVSVTQHSFRCAIEWVRDRWLVLLAAQTLFVEAYVALPNLLLPGRPFLTNDSLFYQFSGWLWVSTPRVPYLHIADIKPPGTVELAALLSLLSGGNPGVLAALSVLATITAVVGTVVLVGLLVFEHTDDALAAYTAGTLPLIYPWYYQYAATGLRPKYFAATFGLLGVFCALRRRWLAGGTAAAFAAAFWQLALVFPVVILLNAVHHGRTNALRRTVGGVSLALVIVLTPFAVAGPVALISMLTQSILAPVFTAETLTLADRLSRLTAFFRMAAPLVAVGLVGALTWRHFDRAAWVPLVVGWFTLGVLAFDLGGRADTFLLLLAAAVGFGLLVAHTDEHILPMGFVFVIAGLMFVVYGDVYGNTIGMITPTPRGYELDYLLRYYWDHNLPNSCYIRQSPPEKQFVQRVGDSLKRDVCRYDFWAVFRQLMGS